MLTCCHPIQVMGWCIWKFSIVLFANTPMQLSLLAKSCTFVTSQMKYNTIWIRWQQGCKHVSRIRLLHIAGWLRSCIVASFRTNLNRFVCVTSWSTQREPGSPKLIEWFLKPLLMSGFIHDMALMENLLMESKLCYTVVRPPGLSNGELLITFRMVT